MKNIQLDRYLKVVMLLISSMIFVISCFPPVVEDKGDMFYTISDPTVQSIINAQDRRLTDSIIPYLSHQKALYRKLAANALGSFQDSLAIPHLIGLLHDDQELVRQAAVFSLGQIGHKNAERDLINAFIGVDSTGPFMKTNSMILEALGKSGTDSSMNLICKIKGYTPKDTLLLYGQMCALYRFGMRGMFCPEGLALLIEIATHNQYPESSRLMAAHSLQRFKNLDLTKYFDVLKSACIDEKNVNIRMCLILATSRIGSPATLTLLEDLYSRGLDVRIQSNIIRGLQHFGGGSASHLALRAVQNPSAQVSLLGAQYLVDHGTELNEDEMTSLALQRGLSWQAKALLYEALLVHIPKYKVLTRRDIINAIKNQIQKSQSPYEKGAYIKSLHNEVLELPYIISLGGKNASFVVKTIITECIESILKNKSFGLYYKGSKNPIYSMVIEYLNEQCNSGNVGSLAVIASIFRSETGLLKYYFKPDSMFGIAKNVLKLPRDIETYNEIETTLAKMNHTKYEVKKVAYNHPIDWQKLNKLKDTINVIITTDKGALNLELYPKLAPGSVANFITLIQESFFNDKFIHRVVPNFVIQAGCPRGDGYGGLDYTIRTEINSSINFQGEGLVGMASAGPDTECSQFFITYSPTPHLDGKYTIFGKMTKGMEVLMAINQGDKIIDVKVAN